MGIGTRLAEPPRGGAPPAASGGAALAPARPIERAISMPLARVIEELPVPIVVTDAAGAIVFSSQAAVGFVEPFAASDAIAAAVQRALRGEVASCEVLTSHERWLAVASRPLLDERGAVAGTVSTVEDLTARRRAEAGLRDEITALRRQVAERTSDLEVSRERLQAADRLASIGSLTAGLGHDLANVLFPIRCRLGALDWARVPAEVADTLHAVVHAAEYLQQLSDGLRLFSKDPSDAMAGVTTDLERWWLQIEPLLRKTMPAHVALEADVPPGLPRPAVAPHQLTQAVLNLVVNAAEAIEERGTVRLQIRSVASGRVVEVAVSDDGHGMSPEILAHIFDPFFTTKRRAMSTGLGLSLVLGVIKSARGTIDVESAPGLGTRFVMRFAAAGAEEGAPGARPRGRAAILLADARQAGWAALHLENEGYEIDRTPAALDAADVLVIDADRDADTIVTRFLEQSAARWVIACGLAPTFAHPRLVHVEGEGAMRGLQSAVRHVAGALSGESR